MPQDKTGRNAGRFTGVCRHDPRHESGKCEGGSDSKPAPKAKPRLTKSK
jgi:hypothetical protein